MAPRERSQAEATRSGATTRPIVTAIRRGALLDPEVHQLYRYDLGVALAEDAPEVAVLIRAPPDDDEVAGGVGGDGRNALIARRAGVDAELRS
jgi:hypothetical protein